MNHVWPCVLDHCVVSPLPLPSTQVPVCGGILLNPGMTHCVLVQSYKGKSWSFPRGKINRGENEVQCAVREVLEEVGFDVSGLIREKDFIRLQVDTRTIVLYIIRNVPDDAYFETQTRKEIGAIDWHHVDGLTSGGKKLWNVTPFAGPLLNWIKSHRRASSASSDPRRVGHGRANSHGHSGRGSASGGSVVMRSAEQQLNAATFGVAPQQQAWDVEAMFAAAERAGIRSTWLGQDGDVPVSNGRFRQYPVQAPIASPDLSSISSGAAVHSASQTLMSMLGIPPPPAPVHAKASASASASPAAPLVRAHSQPNERRGTSGGGGHGGEKRHSKTGGQPARRKEAWDAKNEDTFVEVAAGAAAGWSPEEMFRQNQMLFDVQSDLTSGLRKSHFFKFDDSREARIESPPSLPVLAAVPAAGPRASPTPMVAAAGVGDKKRSSSSSSSSGSQTLAGHAAVPCQAAAAPASTAAASAHILSLIQRPSVTPTADSGVGGAVPAPLFQFSFNSAAIMDSMQLRTP
jgi:ADP-ribose pyrophosphatase YjhB (NUDIX family)